MLPARNFDLRVALDDAGNSGAQNAITQLRQAKAYLFKTNGTANLQDDRVIALGSTGSGSDRIKVRGAERGDKLCVIADGQTPPKIGCQTISSLASIVLTDVPGWQPDVVVQQRTASISPTIGVHINAVSVTSTATVTITRPVTQSIAQALVVTVTQALRDGVQLNVQVLPAYGSLFSTYPITSPWQVMSQVGTSDVYTALIPLDSPVLESYVRVWSSDAFWPGEAMTQVFFSAGNGPISRAGGGPISRAGGGPISRVYGASYRSLAAPMASGDGIVTILNLENLIGGANIATLQALTNAPNLPSWVTQIGRVYRFESPQIRKKSIAFQYLEGDVPKGYEDTLTIYYQPEGSDKWLRLRTALDTTQNLATARLNDDNGNGQGIYALAATIKLPTLEPGWNVLAYTVPETRSVDEALSSIRGVYSAVYEYVSSAPPRWRIYDPNNSVNGQNGPAVTELKFGHAYWILIDGERPVTPYLAIPEQLERRVENE